MQNKPKAKIIIFTFYACFLVLIFLFRFLFVINFFCTFAFLVVLGSVHFVLVSSSLHIRHSLRVDAVFLLLLFLRLLLGVVVIGASCWLPSAVAYHFFSFSP